MPLGGAAHRLMLVTEVAHPDDRGKRFPPSDEGGGRFRRPLLNSATHRDFRFLRFVQQHVRIRSGDLFSTLLRHVRHEGIHRLTGLRNLSGNELLSPVDKLVRLGGCDAGSLRCTGQRIVCNQWRYRNARSTSNCVRRRSNRALRLRRRTSRRHDESNRRRNARRPSRTWLVVARRLSL